MRKIILLIFLFNLGLVAYSQDKPETENAEEEVPYAGNHELKLNAAYLLGGIPEFTYEYILNEESSFGISVAFPIEDEIGLNFIAIPYYRLFFGKKRAAGFFIEGNGAVFSENYEQHVVVNGEVIQNEDRNETGAGLGLGIGGKFMTKSGWVGEIVGGVGRNFINEDNMSAAYPRFGITIGKRF